MRRKLPFVSGCVILLGLAACSDEPQSPRRAGSNDELEVAGEASIRERPRTNPTGENPDKKAADLTAIPPLTPRGTFEIAERMEAKKDRRCLGLYVQSLSCNDFGVRWRALDRLRDLTKQEIDYYAAAPEEERAPGVERWRQWVETEGKTHAIKW